MDGFEKFFSVEGFAEHALDAEALSDGEILAGRDGAAAGHCDDADLREVGAKIEDGIDAVLFGHDDVHQYDVGAGGRVGFQSFHAVGGFGDGVARVFQNLLADAPDGRIVVNDQDMFHTNKCSVVYFGESIPSVRILFEEAQSAETSYITSLVNVAYRLPVRQFVFASADGITGKCDPKTWKLPQYRVIMHIGRSVCIALKVRARDCSKMLRF